MPRANNHRIIGGPHGRVFLTCDSNLLIAPARGISGAPDPRNRVLPIKGGVAHRPEKQETKIYHGQWRRRASGPASPGTPRSSSPCRRPDGASRHRYHSAPPSKSRRSSRTVEEASNVDAGPERDLD